MNYYSKISMATTRKPGHNQTDIDSMKVGHDNLRRPFETKPSGSGPDLIETKPSGSGPDKLPELTYYKLTYKDEIHHGLKYKTGLNEDPLPFNPTGECSSGGMYFIDEIHLSKWNSYIKDPYWIRKVTFPSDAKIYIEQSSHHVNSDKHVYSVKYKCDKFILGDREVFNKDDTDIYVNFEDEYTCQEYVKTCLFHLSNLDERYLTNSVCVAAVKKCGGFLKDLHPDKQTYDICIEAVKKDGLALKYVHNKFQIYSIQAEAIKENPSAIQYVKKTEAESYNRFCIIAIKMNPPVLQHINNPSEEMCLLALFEDIRIFKYIKNKTKEMCLFAVSKDGMNLLYVIPELQTPYLCLVAVLQNGQALQAVRSDLCTEEICMAAIQNEPNAIAYVPLTNDNLSTLTEEMCLLAVRKNKLTIKHIKNPSKNVCETAGICGEKWKCSNHKDE